ncbi:MAG: LysE family transporter [Hoeflea sp.]|nr:LysE family transporter [Hoeflea sp.]
MSFAEWSIFMAIWIAASIPLGPNALNCISVSATFGLKKAIWSVIGVTIAASLHMTLTVTGLAAFASTHPVFFEVIRWLGVAYLAWMGLSMFRSAGTLRVEKSQQSASAQRLVAKAIMISASNPKAIFAWLAVFSQFVDPARPLAGQLAILAPSALSVTVIVYAGYAALGLAVNRIFAGNRKRWFDRFAGSTYLAFALGLATSDLRRA